MAGQNKHASGGVISRRGFLGGLGAAAVSAAVSKVAVAQGKKPFKLKYAPSINAFKANAGGDVIDRLQFMADQGFHAVFDNGFMKKNAAQQEAIAKKLSDLGMDFGPFIGYGGFAKPTFVISDKEIRAMLVDEIKKAVDVHKRTGAKWALVVPGRYDEKLEMSYQTANAIENLKFCAEACEGTDMVMVLEPLNRLWNHPGLFLHRIPQAYQICRAVGSPHCKIVNDIYHQQITEGNLIPNIDAAWEEIAAFHIGDNPGRKEPGTGEINYKNIFKHIKGKGYDGVLCMEHGNSKGKGKEAEMALIETYRACDDF